jgi:type II secretory pathway predicted ATPase ExeA
MYKTYFGMEFDPFEPQADKAGYFSSQDFSQATARLEHLRQLRGIGLFTGHPGSGKTAVVRKWATGLNPGLFKVIYLPMSSITTMEFYRGLCYGLGMEAKFKKIDMFQDIQQRLISLYKDKKITPVLILDEAQYLRAEILNDLKLILNFDMDSKAYAIMILMGLPVLSTVLSRKHHEALAQRIVMNYSFQGLARSEAEPYLTSRLKACGVHQPVFEDSAVETIFAAANGSVRNLNNIASKSLLLAAQKDSRMISSDLILAVRDDMALA